MFNVQLRHYRSSPALTAAAAHGARTAHACPAPPQSPLLPQWRLPSARTSTRRIVVRNRMATRLHISGLAPQTTREELAARFAPFGDVTDVVIVREVPLDDRGFYDELSASRGFGYVSVAPADDDKVDLAIRTYHGVRWRGHTMRVSRAHEHYLIRLARERAEAAEQAHAGDADDDSEHHTDADDARHLHRTELRVRGELKAQLALVDLTAPKSARTQFVDDFSPKPVSELTWVFECGASTGGSAVRSGCARPRHTKQHEGRAPKAQARVAAAFPGHVPVLDRGVLRRRRGLSRRASLRMALAERLLLRRRARAPGSRRRKTTLLGAAAC